jgi:hypothetical protein
MQMGQGSGGFRGFSQPDISMASWRSDRAGNVFQPAGSIQMPLGTIAGPYYKLIHTNTGMGYQNGLINIFYQGVSSFSIGAQGNCQILGNVATFKLSLPSNNASSVTLICDADNILAQRNGTNSQTFSIYNTFTSSTNLEKCFVSWDGSNVMRIYTAAGSGGGTVRDLTLGTTGATNGEYLRFSASAVTMNAAVPLDMGSHKITSVSDPTSAQDAATSHLLPPIGSVIAWAKSITGVPALPTGWQECDGSAIASGPMTGQNTPNLNGTNSFPRGNTTSGGTGGAATHVHSYSGATDTEDGDTDVSANDATAIALGIGAATVAAAGHVHTYAGTTDSASSLPPYIDMVYIIRIS